MPFGWVAGGIALGGLLGGGGGGGAQYYSDEAVELGREELEFSKEQYEDQRPMREAASRRQMAISDAQLRGMNAAQQYAAEDRNYMNTTFRPVERGLVSEAQNYDTPGRRAAAMAGARADVEQAFGSSQAGMNRAIMRTGGTVGGSRSRALMQDAALEKAKAIAGATTGASRNVEQQGWARRMDSASLGRGLPGNQATQQGIALQSGSASGNNALGALQAQQSGQQGMHQGFQGAQNAMLGAGRLALGQQQQDDQWMQMLGSMAGMYAASDRDIKRKTGKKADSKKALDEINATKVEEGWEYDPAKGGPDDGGVKHTGPMAQTVRKTMGEDAAPGGEMISLVDMNGKLMAGMQELTQRVKKIEKKVRQ